jgi:AraC-like DNA-binding protein
MKSKQTSYRPDFDLLDLPFVKKLGIESSRRAMNLPWHKNDGFELTFAFHGEYIWEIRDEARIDKLYLTGGTLGLTPPNVYHRGYDSLIGPGELLFIVFDFGVDGAEACTGMRSQDLAEFNQLWKDIDTGTAFIDPSTRSYCHELAFLLKDIRENQSNLLRKYEMRTLILQVLIGALICFQNPRKQSESSPIQVACRYMEDHICDNLKMEEIASSAGLGKTRFYELFSKEKGVSPGEYYSQIRCRKACTLLRETRKSMTEIAFECCYSSSQYFSSCMRKFTGCSPSEYRQKQKS